MHLSLPSRFASLLLKIHFFHVLCQRKFSFINLSGNFLNKKREKAHPEKMEDTKSEAAGDIPGELYGSDIKGSSPSTAHTAGAQ